MLRKAVASLKSIFAKPQNSPKINENLSIRFTEVYNENHWGDPQSVSGTGSRQDSPSVKAALEALRLLTRTHKIRSINDIPCGDFNWISSFLDENPKIRYKGFDIVSPLIERNEKLFPRFAFQLLDITASIPPKADLIFSKDLLNHLTNADVQQAIKNMKASKSKFLLASNNFGFENVELAANIQGATRFLDITAPPFDFPKPIWNTDYLGLWKLADL